MEKIKIPKLNKKYIEIGVHVILTFALASFLYLLIFNLDHITETVKMGMGSLTTALAPLIIGLVIAYILGPVVNIIELRLLKNLFPIENKSDEQIVKANKARRSLSVALTFIAIIVLLLLLIYGFAVLIVGGVFYGSLEGAVDTVTTYFVQYQNTLGKISDSIPGTNLDKGMHDIIRTFSNWFSGHFSMGGILGFVAGAFGGILNTALGFIVSAYVLKDKELFLRSYFRVINVMMTESASKKFHGFLSNANLAIGQFFHGRLLCCLFVAVTSSIGLSIIGLDYAVPIGCLIGALDIIPYFGPILGIAPAVVMALITGDFTQAILAAAIILVIQPIEGAFITPKFVGKTTGLHPVVVLVAITTGGFYFGIMGMIFAVPVVSLIKIFGTGYLLQKEALLTELK